MESRKHQCKFFVTNTPQRVATCEQSSSTGLAPHKQLGCHTSGWCLTAWWWWCGCPNVVVCAPKHLQSSRSLQQCLLAGPGHCSACHPHEVYQALPVDDVNAHTKLLPCLQAVLPPLQPGQGARPMSPCSPRLP